MTVFSLNFFVSCFMAYVMVNVWCSMTFTEKLLMSVVFLGNAGYVVYDVFKFLS